MSLHLKIPSSQLSSLQMKSQFTEVQHLPVPCGYVYHMVLYICNNLCVIVAGRDAVVAEAALSHPPAQVDGAVSDSPPAPQTCADRHSHDGLHGLGGFIPSQQPL